LDEDDEAIEAALWSRIFRQISYDCTLDGRAVSFPSQEHGSRAWVVQMQYNAACAKLCTVSERRHERCYSCGCTYRKNNCPASTGDCTRILDALSEPILCRHRNTQPRTFIAVGWRPTSSRQAEMVLSMPGVVCSQARYSSDYDCAVLYDIATCFVFCFVFNRNIEYLAFKDSNQAFFGI